MTDFERKVEVRGAFDRTHPDPAKNYGVHCMELRFVLSGPKGAVQFLVYTGMFLPHVFQRFIRSPRAELHLQPRGADIGCHSLTPQYEGQKALTDYCPYLDGKPCYFDGSSLQADEFMPTFLEGGDEVVWPMLEERYRRQFGEDDTEALGLVQTVQVEAAMEARP